MRFDGQFAKREAQASGLFATSAAGFDLAEFIENTVNVFGWNALARVAHIKANHLGVGFIARRANGDFARCRREFNRVAEQVD